MARPKTGIQLDWISFMVPKKEKAKWKKTFYNFYYEEKEPVMYYCIKDNPQLTLKEVASALKKRKKAIINFCNKVGLPVPKDI